MRNYDDLTEEEINFIESLVIGEKYYFWELKNGDSISNYEEILDDGSYSPDEWNVIEFDIIEYDKEEPWESLVKITDIL